MVIWSLRSKISDVLTYFVSPERNIYRDHSQNTFKTSPPGGCDIYQAPSLILLYPFFHICLNTIHWDASEVITRVCFHTGKLSIKKCESVKRKREKAKEVSELDVSSNIPTQGNYLSPFFVCYYLLLLVLLSNKARFLTIIHWPNLEMVASL